MTKPRLLLGLLFLALAAPAMSSEGEDQIKTLVQLVESGQFHRAFDIADANQNRLGEAEFDFLYGLAALETGRYGVALLAFERVRAARPGDQYAWLQMGRALFHLGEVDRAQAEFAALAAEAKEPLASRVKSWHDLAAERVAERRGRKRYYVELGLAHDSNVNGGLDGGGVDLSKYGFGHFHPRGDQVAVSDNRLEAAGGGEYSRLIGPGKTAFAGVDANQQLHLNAGEYNQTGIGAYAGLAWLRGGQQWRLIGSSHLLAVDFHTHRNTIGVTGEWSAPLDSRRGVSAYGQFTRFDYTSAGGGERDSNLLGVGGGYRHALGFSGRPTISLVGGYALDRNAKGRDDYSRNILSLNGGASITPMPRLRVGVNQTFIISNYDAADRALGDTRKDNLQLLTVHGNYALRDRLALRGELALTRNDSNIDLFDYERKLLSFKLRYDFR